MDGKETEKMEKQIPIDRKKWADLKMPEKVERLAETIEDLLWRIELIEKWRDS